MFKFELRGMGKSLLNIMKIKYVLSVNKDGSNNALVKHGTNIYLINFNKITY